MLIFSLPTLPKESPSSLKSSHGETFIFYLPIHVFILHFQDVDQGNSDPEAEANMNYLSHLNEEYINGVNGLISGQSVDTAVTFLYLPCPPTDPALHPDYLRLLTGITNGLKPTVMVHGISAVTTTNL